MGQWLRNRRERFLDELLRLEGRGDHRWQTKCSTCPEVVGMVYRCRDCFTDALFCQPCVVTTHKDNPLHRVEMWRDGHFFEGVSLKSLGLRIQLGHGRNGTCTGTLARAREEAAKPLRDDFCIIDSNGVHEVALDFCSCSRAEDHDIQLLRARLYPATTTNPATAATFRVLRDFHLLSLEAKSSAHHFYNKLARQTNNNGTRYAEFRRMARQWRNLQMFKRAGRGHAADGIAGTKAGECALLCPACPQPGKNLPRDGSWKVVPRERRFLYALFLALDANFRMKRKDVSSEADDPSLGDGVAFFSQVDEYMRHLESHWDLEQEKSTCVAHDAVDEPNREAHGTAASGIGTVDCARHNMKRPNGVADLQKGEKYINMDYMLWKSLKNDDEIIQLFISYDIVCQWSKNIWRRLAQYNPELRQSAGNPKDRYYVWLIPKFHLPAHIEACNILFSFNLTPYVGQTDGEAPERGWANANPLATSTKEMGPGARRDALDDHFNDWNHKKIVGLGKFLLERAKKAVDNMTTCRLELLETELGLPREAVEKWTREMELWELDDTNPNPFKIVEKHEGIFAIRGRLAEQASTAVAGDAADDVRGDLHAHEMQRDLAFDAGAVKLHATDRQKTALVERSNKLGRKINEWLKIRESFAPVLWLPSKLITVKPSVAVKPSHARYEFELRVGQAHAALEELRRLLLVRTAKYHYKDQFERGVSSNTRAKTSIQNVDERIRRTAAGYRVARLALVNLGPMLGESAWKNQLRVLAADDVRQRPRATFSDPEHKMRKKRRKRADPRVWAADARQKRDEERTASWIWMSQLSAEEEEETGMADALRVEWAKTRAKAWRWTEEVDLVEEEMRRVVAFLEWKAERWARQARIQLDLRDVFSETWKDIPRYIALGRDTLGKIPPEQEESGEGVDAEGKDEDEEGDEEDDEAPVAETAPNPKVAASFVEESLV
ncbi:hypothetical protein B0H14DRAFT_3082330 [Mycena olivaceomarginata]|nr:hypothetical protein B0H14DRAFT_3082330 [Mycena olivaceomarginata]